MNAVTETFALARQYGIIVPGLTATYAQITTWVNDADEAHNDYLAEARAEAHWESNWAGADQYRWEEEQDRLRNPFDPQAF